MGLFQGEWCGAEDKVRRSFVEGIKGRNMSEMSSWQKSELIFFFCVPAPLERHSLGCYAVSTGTTRMIFVDLLPSLKVLCN